MYRPYRICSLSPNIFSILRNFFQSTVGFRSNRLARATINQIVMKKDKFFIFHKLERLVLKSSKNEKQQFPGNPLNIENLFVCHSMILLFLFIFLFF